jgi:hypothetical protein
MFTVYHLHTVDCRPSAVLTQDHANSVNDWPLIVCAYLTYKYLLCAIDLQMSDDEKDVREYAWGKGSGTHISLIFAV